MAGKRKHCCLTVVLALTVGCTPPGGQPSRDSETAAEKRAPARLETFEVIDRAGRWKTQVTALEEPTVKTMPGYVHIAVERGTEHAINCFVYDAPLVTGQAIGRLLSAIEIGIAFRRAELLSVEDFEKNPLLVVRADYVSEDEGSSGTLFVSVAPRVKLPVVCSHEGESEPAHVLDVTRALVAQLDPPSWFADPGLFPEEELLAWEMWRLSNGGAPIGFRQWRATTKQDGTVQTIEITATLQSSGKLLSTLDARVLESADEQGLAQSSWIEFRGVDGPRAGAALERTHATAQSFGYRVEYSRPTGVVQHEFDTTEPVRSSYFTLLERRAEPHPYLRYLPSFDSKGATKVEREPGRSGTTRLRVGDESYELFWSEEGELHKRRTADGFEAELLLREAPGDSEAAGK